MSNKTLAETVYDTLTETFPGHTFTGMSIDREVVVKGQPSIEVCGWVDGRDFEATFAKVNHMTFQQIADVLASHVRRSLS